MVGKGIVADLAAFSSQLAVEQLIQSFQPLALTPAAGLAHHLSIEGNANHCRHFGIGLRQGAKPLQALLDYRLNALRQFQKKFNF